MNLMIFWKPFRREGRQTALVKKRYKNIEKRQNAPLLFQEVVLVCIW